MTIWRQKLCETRCRRYASILRYTLCGFNNVLFGKGTLPWVTKSDEIVEIL